MTSCEEEFEISELEDLKSSGTDGARAALLATTARYSLDQDTNLPAFRALYSRISPSSSACIISVIQDAVHRDLVEVDNRTLQTVLKAPREISASYLSGIEHYKAASPSFDLMFNQLTRCVIVEAGAHRSGFSDTIASCITEDVTEYCIANSETGEVRTSGFTKLPEIEPEPEPSEPTEISKTEKPAAKEESPSPSPSETEPEPEETELAEEPSSTTAPAQPPIQTGTPVPSPSPEPTLSEPPRVNPPDYAENPRPVPTGLPSDPTQEPDQDSYDPTESPGATESRNTSWFTEPSAD